MQSKAFEWVQIDEPILSLELEEDYRDALRTSFSALNGQGVKLLLATYFDSVNDYLSDIAAYPVEGVHFDCVAGAHDVAALHTLLAKDQVLSLGVVNGRNVWRTDLAVVFEKNRGGCQATGAITCG